MSSYVRARSLTHTYTMIAFIVGTKIYRRSHTHENDTRTIHYLTRVQSFFGFSWMCRYVQQNYYVAIEFNFYNSCWSFTFPCNSSSLYSAVSLNLALNSLYVYFGIKEQSEIESDSHNQSHRFTLDLLFAFADSGSAYFSGFILLCFG